MASGEPVASASAATSFQSITVHILCPSLPAPNRFTFNDLPLSSSVAQLRSRIAESLPTRPAPAMQRLIYRGKPLTNAHATLEDVLSPIDGSEYSIHLVLPPLPPTPTAPALSAQNTSLPNFPRLFEQTTPFMSTSVTTSRTVHSSEGIRHRGTSNATSSLFGQRSGDFQHQIASLERSLERNRQLLSQSAGQPDTSLSSQNARGSAANSVPDAAPVQTGPNSSATTASTLSGTSVFDRTSTLMPSLPHQSHTNTSLPRASAHRFPSSVFLGSPYGSSASTNSYASSFPTASNAGSGTTSSATAAAHHTNFNPSRPGLSSTTAQNALSSPISPPLFPPGENVLGHSPPSLLEAHRNYVALLIQIGDVERQLERGVIPPMETLFHMRLQLLEMLRNQPDDPIAGFYPGRNELQLTQNRIQQIYQRVDQITQRFSLSQNNGAPTNTDLTADATDTIYLVTSPDGTQSLIMPPSTGVLSAAPQGPRTRQTAPPSGSNPSLAPRPQGNDAAIVENVLRQAVLNHERRQQDNDARGQGPGRHFRRVWLFVRMYFFIYMISDSGTWSRVIFVTLAVFIALFSDTDIPRQLHGLVIAPFQRHLEGLAHMGGPTQQAGQGRTGQHANHHADGPPQDTLATEVWQYLRRAERALVLLLASLIPGVGERQVHARHAAEAEAERLRQEEQQQQQEEQRAQQHLRMQEHEHERVGGMDPIVNGAHGSAHAEQQAQSAQATSSA